MKYWFTSDEHYGHFNILEYCKRSFETVEEMDDEIIKRHNEVVKDDDIVIHAGDFTLKKDAEQYIRRLKGNHIFLEGSHDYWMGQDHTFKQIWEKNINGTYVVVCHYPFRSWPRSFHGSLNLFGHCHGKMKPEGSQYDIGVDNNNYYPVSLEQILKKICQK